MKTWGKRFLAGETTVEEEVAHWTGLKLTGLTFKAQEGGWLLVVKVFSFRRGALVAFFGGHTTTDCLDALGNRLSTQPGVEWKPDLYEGTGVGKRKMG